MRYLQLFILLASFAVSCQNQTADKTGQKHSDDTTKVDKPTANINTTKPESSNDDFLNFWQKFRVAVINFALPK